MPRYSSLRNQFVTGDDPTLYAANGALTISDGVHAITKTSIAALTLAAPTAGDQGTRMVITSRTAFAHTVTVSGGIGGRGATHDVITFAAIGDTIELMADNLVWVPVGAGYGVTIA